MEDSLSSIFSDDIFSDQGIRTLVEALPRREDLLRTYQVGETLLLEGELNDNLMILIEGHARLIKRDASGKSIVVDTFGPGTLLGLTSFWGHTQVFASVQADSLLKCVLIDRILFDSLTAENPNFVRAVQGLFVRNLSDRYRNMIRSQVAREQLSAQLQEERDQLRIALKRLETTTNRLVNQEKLATMGQLLAGIAHEINNPVGALLRGVDSAKAALVSAFAVDGKNALEGLLAREGWKCPYWSSDEKRQRMDSVAKKYPEIPRPLVRRLAQLTDPAFEAVRHLLPKRIRELEHLLSIYEFGVCFRAVKLSSSRIEKVVTSLRNYGRQGATEWEDCNLADGIRDTLTVLNNRLKRYDVKMDMKELPKISCNMGEINQVWTNLLVNAMDATKAGGEIVISADSDDDDICVCIEDSGTGIPKEKLDTIFQANYTTKNSSGSFGLGLGLSISREIVEKHGGTLQASNRPQGGARFEARFPLSTV